MTRHEHHKRFDMDNPWLTCDCGGYWDALTGEPMKVDTATRPVTPEFARGYSAGFTAAATADPTGSVSVERLAEAMRTKVARRVAHMGTINEQAAVIAEEYDRLARNVHGADACAWGGKCGCERRARLESR